MINKMNKIFDAKSGKPMRVKFNLLKVANRNEARKTFGHNAAAKKT